MRGLGSSDVWRGVPRAMDRRCLRLRCVAAERLRGVSRLRGRWEVWLTVERLRRYRGNVGDWRGGAGQPVMKSRRIHSEEFDLVRENSDRVLEIPYQRLRWVRSHVRYQYKRYEPPGSAPPLFAMSWNPSSRSRFLSSSHAGYLGAWPRSAESRRVQMSLKPCP